MAMGLISMQLYKTTPKNQSKPFCECPSDNYFLQCKCGESSDGAKQLEWTWKNTKEQQQHDADITNDDTLVKFHPVYSQGTSVVSGTKALERHKIHYWEIKILTPLSGTDFVKIDLINLNIVF